jgi:hypothetical protein
MISEDADILFCPRISSIYVDTFGTDVVACRIAASIAMVVESLPVSYMAPTTYAGSKEKACSDPS